MGLGVEQPYVQVVGVVEVYNSYHPYRMGFSCGTHFFKVFLIFDPGVKTFLKKTHQKVKMYGSGHQQYLQVVGGGFKYSSFFFGGWC